MADEAKKVRGRGRWGGKRGLFIELSAESAAVLRAMALYPDARADHVTLAFGVDLESFRPEWIPGGYAIGSRVPMRAIGACADGRVQAVLIAIDGGTERPWDGARLHVTVSKQPRARSSESNALILSSTPEPLDLPIEGVVRWSDEE